MTRIQWRRDTAAAWAAANPILFEGEAGMETDTFKVKLGDGVSAWNDLESGFASLDSSGKVPFSQLYTPGVDGGTASSSPTGQSIDGGLA